MRLFLLRNNYEIKYTKYAPYAASIAIAHGRVSIFVLTVAIQRSTPAASATIASTRKVASKMIGIISELVPITNKILKIFDPTMLPIAISQFPFFAAVTEVTSSGSDVPNATIVRPIKRSDKPSADAIVVAAPTVISAPHTTIAAPTTPNKISFHTGLSSGSSSS